MASGRRWLHASNGLFEAHDESRQGFGLFGVEMQGKHRHCNGDIHHRNRDDD